MKNYKLKKDIDARTVMDAIKCCSQSKGCGSCPLQDDGDFTVCTSDLAAYSKLLIERLYDEIKIRDEIIEQMHDELDKEEAEEKQDENDGHD